MCAQYNTDQTSHQYVAAFTLMCIFGILPLCRTWQCLQYLVTQSLSIGWERTPQNQIGFHL